MIINKHILKLSDIYYHKKQFYINNNNPHLDKFIYNYSLQTFDTEINNIEKIENMFVIKTLHHCFCHAIIDCLFPIYWAINDINNTNNKNINLKNLTLFIRKHEFIKYPAYNLRKVNNNKYKGCWHDLISIISEKNIFEHTLDNNRVFFIKNCYFYIKDDNHSRSPWSCNKYFNGRGSQIPSFSDLILKKQLTSFSNFVKSKYNLQKQNLNRNIVLINRRGRRNIDEIIDKLDKILNNFNNYKGIVYLEDLSFREQIELFINNFIFIAPHGAGMIHHIWSKNKVIIEIISTSGLNRMYKRISDITNNLIFQVDRKHILSNIKEIIKLVLNTYVEHDPLKIISSPYKKKCYSVYFPQKNILKYEIRNKELILF